jgi:hypothetical protein
MVAEYGYGNGGQERGLMALPANKALQGLPATVYCRCSGIRKSET